MPADRLCCFFLGGASDEVVADLINNLKKNIKGICVKGHFVPPMVEKIDGSLKEDIIAGINRCKPDIVWVGLSAPKQETWISENIESIDAYMACGIGAVFDFYSNKVKRAPRWLQNSGLEWFYRMISEPKRLMKKYFIYNSKFIVLAIKYLLGKKFKKNV